MATIVYNAENIADVYAPSLNAAFVEVFQTSGVRPRVVAPYGAWSSPAIDAQYGIKGRGPASDHYKGRAVDIANYAAIASVIDLSRLKAIMARHGWGNIQVNGDAFPTEPWHYANHSSHPAGSGGVPLPGDPVLPPRRRHIMTNLFHKLSTKPFLYAFAGDSPGTPANWHETTDEGLATQWSALQGISSIGLNDATWAQYKADYLAPVRVDGVAVGAGGTFVLDDTTIAKLAQANAEFFFAEQKKPGN